MTDVKTEDLIYIAGIVDGEGSIGISMIKQEANRAGVLFVPFISVTNTNVPLIDLIYDTFPQFCKSLKKAEHSRFRSNKDCYCLRATHQKAYEVLEKIYPYLRVKKDQASLLMHLREIRKGAESTNYSDYDIDMQYELFRQVCLLNGSKEGEGEGRRIAPKPEIRPHRNGPQATKGYSKRLKEYFTGCKIDGCQNEHCMMGYCRLHYRQLHESKTYLEGNAVRECLECAKDIKHLRIDRKFCCVACKSRWHRKAKKDAIIN